MIAESDSPLRKATTIDATSTVRVVGVAVLRSSSDGRQVLAARRTAPPAAAGGWELPGGKCDPGETIVDAAVREVREELGCTVRVTGVLAGVVPIAPGLVLEVVTAELVDGTPTPSEHDALRWLTAGELHEVRWLPADLPFLDELGQLLRAAT